MAKRKAPRSDSNASAADGVETASPMPAAGLRLDAQQHGSPRDASEATSGAPLEPADEGYGALAWRLLSSPRTLLGLSAALALVLALGAPLPQRPGAAELARRLSFASGDVASGLGLLDVLTAWPTLLLALLIALNAVGLIVARTFGAATATRGGLVAHASALLAEPLESVRARIAEGRVAGLGRVPLRMQGATTSGRRGLAREGGALALLGAVALLIGAVVARGSALDARLELAPGTRTLSEAVARDGDLFLARSLPYGLMCERPDPQDPRRAFDCRLASGQPFGPSAGAGTGTTEPAQVSLAPGYTTRVGDLELSPLRERLRRFADDEAYELVLTRAGSKVERLRLEPGKTVALRASGQQLTAFAGPDGPLLVVEADGAPPVLLAPLSEAGIKQPLGGLEIEAVAATQLVVSATSAPEAPLVLAGTLLVALGLLLMGLVPHLELTLEAAAGGSRISLWSTNRPSLPRALLQRVVDTSLPAAPEGSPSSGVRPTPSAQDSAEART